MLLNNKLLARRDILPPRLIGFMLGLTLLCVFPKASADFLTQTAIGETIPSTLDEGDFPYNGKLFEVYSFEGVKGQEIFLNLSSFGFDPILWLVNSQGQFIAFDDDGGDAMGALISRFSLPETGIYFSAVGSKNAGEFGAYTLSLNQAPWVNYSGGPLEEIFIGDEVSGNLTDSSSAQWSTGQYFNAYQFEAEPGQAISIVMRSQQFKTYLWLLDHQGKVITVNDNKIIFFPSTSGNYFIGASSSLPLKQGAYELILKTTHQPTQAKPLSGTVSEKLETADFQLSTGQYLDVYTFQGAMDEHVSIGLKSSEFDSYLRILDSAGNVLREDDDSAGGQDALIEDFVLPDTGQYFVWISSVFAGGIGPYSLSFNDVSPRRLKTKDTIKLVLSRQKGKKLRGKAESFANSSRCLGSLETYTAKVNICNRENESHSGSISLSGPSDIVISPGTMDFTLPPHTCTTKSPFYITTASATTGVKTITAEAQIGENIGSDSEDLHVVKVEVFRDANFSQPLTDWPASGGNPISPRFLFASDDPIYVQVTGLGKNPSQQETISDAIHVLSETDPTGIPLTLTETGVNTDVFRNSGDLLFLSSESSQGSQKKIKVVDEEILSFKPSNKSCFDVMVDRAEFSSNGIHIFYGSPTGDRAIVRTEALTNTKFFDAGDTDFPSVGAGEPMRTFIKDVGLNQAGDGEADIMHVSSHGNADGALWDNASNVINPADDISNSSDFNLDAEWLVLAACSTLNQWGGGKDAWSSAMNGNPRGLHGVLGAYATLSADLQDVYQGFWERMRQGYTIKDAYGAAMELDNPTPEHWAVIHHSANGDDKLDDFTQDVQTQSRSRASSGIRYSFLDTKTAICDQVGSCEEEIKDTVDNGNGIVRVDFPPLLPSQKTLAIQQKMYPVNFNTKSRLPFAQKVSRKQDGRTVFEGELSFDAESTLSEGGAISLAEDLIRQYLPDLAPLSKLKKVSVRKSSTGDRTWVNGYIVQFDLFNGALPIWGDHIRVSIFGNQLGAASILSHQNATKSKNLQNTRSSMLELSDALAISLDDIRIDLGINGKYEILDAGLWSVLESLIKEQGSNTTYIPVWHLVFNPDYQGEGSNRDELYHVWVDPITGGYISKTSLDHR